MATSHKYVQTETKRWTYGAELELVDWPRNEPLPNGMQVDDGAYTNVNSNGVAADGPGRLYHLGGEILTAPSVEITGPAEQYGQIIDRWPQTALNYRMGLNVHVRIPGLDEDLEMLKRIQRFVHRLMPELLPTIDPIPEPIKEDYTKEEYKGARKCYATRKKDHHTLLSEKRLALQMSSTTPKEFFEAEAIDVKTGKVHWAISPRTCVNLRQILQTDTIEFRHFFMPNGPKELEECTRWCHFFLQAAIIDDTDYLTSDDLLDEFDWDSREWPVALDYDPWLDRGWYYTTRRYNKVKDVPRRIEEWLNNEGGVNDE